MLSRSVFIELNVKVAAGNKGDSCYKSKKTWQQSESSTRANLVKVGPKNTLFEQFQVILINFTALLVVRSCLAIIKE